MLLEFQAKNYKSFCDGFIFSMIPAPKQKGLDYSILTEKIGRIVYKGLSSAVIYGPNASGKSNIISAMDTFKTIILRGNIKNADGISSPNAASYALEMIPCCSETNESSVGFAIKFIDSGITVEYTIKMDIGIFLEKNHIRKISEEELFVNEKHVFLRRDTLAIDDISTIKDYLNDGIDKNLDSAKEIAKNGLNKEELFLVNGFKSIFSKKLVSLISDWFENRFMVIYRSDAIKTMHRFADPKENTIYIEKTLNDAAKTFGINSNALGYKVTKEGAEATLYSVFNNDSKGMAVPAELFESYGTVRFINEFPLVINSLLNGGTLVMDEFDASIHPMALMSIINMFHNDDINKKHAQLIFNTHNPIFLNANLFRRDEIKFVERDENTHMSVHYSLSDFKTAGKSGVRKGEDYMKNYFVSQYGAIKDIDFSPILEKLVKAKEGESRD